jgi:hypothetical protein
MNLDFSSVETAPRIITCTIEGILEPDDLAALADGSLVGEAGPKEVEDPSNLKRIRERHHSLARLVASGMSQDLVASICNYTPSYVSILLNNPAMKELVEHYRIINGNSSTVIAERLRTVGLKALETLNDKLDNEEITDTHELAAVAKLGLDRAGHGPTSTTHTVSETHLIDHARIAELNERARAGSREFIVPVSSVRAALTHNPSPEPASDAND